MRVRVCVCVSFFKRVKKGIFYGDFKFVTKTEIKNEEGDVVAQLGKKTLVHWTIHKKCH